MYPLRPPKRLAANWAHHFSEPISALLVQQMAAMSERARALLLAAHDLEANDARSLQTDQALNLSLQFSDATLGVPRHHFFLHRASFRSDLPRGHVRLGLSAFRNPGSPLIIIGAAAAVDVDHILPLLFWGRGHGVWDSRLGGGGVLLYIDKRVPA